MTDTTIPDFPLIAANATFADLRFGPHKSQPMFDTQAVAFFPNNYGISVVTGMSAYGAYEAAVIHKDGKGSFDIIYDTPITDDVVGHLNPQSITELMQRIAALPERTTD